MFHTSFSLEEFQSEAIKQIDQRHDLLVCAPTGSGKTIIAEYAMTKHIKDKVVYTSPIKALSNQKYKYFKEKYPNSNIGLVTGDTKLNVGANFVIMTTEILRNIIIYGSDTNFFEHLECVILDEIHYINQMDRGHVWEELLLILPANIQIIMLSATMPDIYTFKNNLEKVRGKEISYIESKTRSVPLEIYHCIEESDNKIEFNKLMNADGSWDEISLKMSYYHPDKQIIGKVIKKLYTEQMLPAIFFVFSQRRCTEYGSGTYKSITNREEKEEIKIIINQYEGRYPNIFHHYPSFKKMLINGFAYHHAGLLPIVKELVETLLDKKLVKIIFATETFAIGVHYPVRTVIFTSLTKWDGLDYNILSRTEYIQMMGRAGRRGLDEKGYVIILPLDKYSSISKVKKILRSDEEIFESKLKLDSRFVLRYGFSKLFNVQSVIAKSLYALEISHKIVHLNSSISELGANIERLKSENIDKYTLCMEELIMSIDKKKLEMLNNDLKKIIECEKELKMRKNELYLASNLITKRIEQVYIFLERMEYISKHDGTYVLNNSGKIAQRINECNEIILTEVITKNILNNLSCTNIAVVLSTFAADNNIPVEDTVDFVDNTLKEDSYFLGIIDKISIIKSTDIDDHYIENIFEQSVSFDRSAYYNRNNIIEIMKIELMIIADSRKIKYTESYLGEIAKKNVGNIEYPWNIKQVTKIFDQHFKPSKKNYMNAIAKLSLDKKKELLEIMKMIKREYDKREVYLDDLLVKAFDLLKRKNRDHILQSWIEKTIETHPDKFIPYMIRKDTNIARIKNFIQNNFSEIREGKILEISENIFTHLESYSLDGIDYWYYCLAIILRVIKKEIENEWLYTVCSKILDINAVTNEINPDKYYWNPCNPYTKLLRIWIDSGDINKSIEQDNDISIGNFISHVSRTIRICHELIGIYNHLGNTCMVDKINNVKELLLEDQTIRDNIY